MKTDDQLSQLLGTWRVDPPPTPNFQREVWARIQLQQEQPATGLAAVLREWFVLKLPQPVYATAFIAVFTLTGLGVASLAVTRIERNERTMLRERYLTSIDPVAMAGQRLRLP